MPPKDVAESSKRTSPQKKHKHKTRRKTPKTEMTENSEGTMISVLALMIGIPVGLLVSAFLLGSAFLSTLYHLIL